MQRKDQHSNNPSGRPRSSDLTERLHRAVWRLLESGSWNDLTMERIAKEAGVSRPALYRRYNGAGPVVLGALLAFGANSLPMPYSGSLEDDLQVYFEAVVSSLERGDPVGKALRGVLAQALIDDAFAQEFQEFIRQRREPVRRRIASGRSAWSERQVEAALDTLFGPVLYRLLIRGEPVSQSNVVELIDCAINPRGVRT